MPTWEIRVRRLSEQTRADDTRTVGAYEVLHDGARATNTIRVDGFDVPLFGTTAESCGPSQNDAPATPDNPSRIVAKSYRLATSGGPEYLTRNYRADEQIAPAMPGIELLDTGNRFAIIIHPGKGVFLSSIGCINLCKELPNAEENIDYRGSRRRVIALIEDMKQVLGGIPAAGDQPIPGASIAIDESALAAAQPPASFVAASNPPTVAGNGIGWPLAHNVIRRGINNHTFGMVRNGGARPHQGWDFHAPVNTPCFAICDGKVALVYESGDYGKVAVLAFPFKGRNLYAAYAHLNAIDVRTGQTVTKGQRIGLTGNTGNARGMTGPDQHLHFEIRTVPRPGRGLADRMSPKDVFGVCPLSAAVEA
jgi:murein DD-endopeptidase MepM/ murein hydrolase activator NlpD